MKSKLQLLLDTLSEGVTIADLEGNILQVNDVGVRFHGYRSKQELIGRNFFELIAEKDRERAREDMNRILDNGPVRNIEYAFLRKDGSESYAEFSAAVLKDTLGNPRGFVTSLWDLTGRKKADARVLAYQKQLRSLASQLSLAEERERRRIAVQLHDCVSQNLAVCRAKLRALMQSAPSIVEPLDEIDILLEELIKHTRSLTFELSSPLLYEIGLEAAVEQITEQIGEESGIGYKFKHHGRLTSLDNDMRVALFQIVRELLVNVKKHAQAHGVAVDMKQRDGEMRITVKDDGVGFDVCQVLSGKGGRRGFGLLSIQERMHHIGGNVEIKSQPGRGTTVTVITPIDSG